MDDNHLMHVIKQQARRIVELRDNIVSLRENRHPPRYSEYAWVRLESMLNEIVREATDIADAEVQLSLIARDEFGGDVAIKIPRLLHAGGPKAFTEKFQGPIVEALRRDEHSGVIRRVDVKGMYINLLLTDAWIMESARSIVELGDRFLQSDVMAGQNVVIDYSSPNIAKRLHAGHIRSTIVGHVLANLFDACGACAFRLNHINDFGGFGFILEGYRKFHDLMPEGMPEGERMVEIYAIRRRLEAIVNDKRTPAAWTDEERLYVTRYLPGVTDLAGVEAAFNRFNKAADKAFDRLERGEQDEVTLWQQLVRISLDDFSSFYRQLDIEIDFVIGESFYFYDGSDLVNRGVENGVAVIFTEKMAAAARCRIDELAKAGKLSAEEAQTTKAAIDKDIGATVVELGESERLVVRRSDGLSIYATRDLGAIHRRNELFDPDVVVYVVGQEQRLHFENLFAAADKFGLVRDGVPHLEHLYFGFYIDTTTKKKLSSRDSVSNVYRLLELSREYFFERIGERSNMTTAERKMAAHELTIGSLVFNDLKQDIKGSVDVDTSSHENTVRGFEQAGGAYVVYATCRARSIIRKSTSLGSAEVDELEYELSDQEAHLILSLQQMPVHVVAATEQRQPTMLVRHLLKTAMQYNSYYTSMPVLVDGVPNPARMLITNAVEVALNRGLRICHITCPDRI